MSGESTTLTPEQEAADFAEGFADNLLESPTETPGNQDGDGETSEAQAAKEPEKEPDAPAVEYVQLTKAERDELMGLRAQQEKSFGTAFGKIGGFERWKSEQEARSAKVREIQSRITQEHVDSLKDDFPPLADGLDLIRSLDAIGGSGPSKAEIEELIREARELAKQETHMDLLEAEHEDWRDVATTPEWFAWKAQQSKAVQEKLDSSWNSKFLARQFDLFKQSLSKAQVRQQEKTPGEFDQASARRSRMSAAVTPRGVGGNAGPNATDEFLAGFNE